MTTATHSDRYALRPYQEAARRAIHAGFREFDRQLAVLPTGAGKTRIFAQLAADLQPGRTLILAHREELIGQAVDKLHAATGIQADVEMADRWASHHAPVVVASVQTLMRQSRRDRWPENHFRLVVADESHRAISPSWQTVLSRFHNHAQVIGVTATADRGDKRNLGVYFQNIAFEISLLDLVRDGWLCPIRVKTVPLGIDLRRVRSTAGDYNADDLGDALGPWLDRIADVLAAHRDRKTLVFLPLISVSQDFAQRCRQRGLAAEHVDGESRDRARILERFRRNETRLLCNAMLLVEGFDEPTIDCVVCLRPTKVRSLYCLDEQTEILTAQGWSREVDPGEPVAAFDSSSGEIRFVPALATIRRPLEPGERFVSYHGIHADFRVTDGHRMLYDNRRRHGWRFKIAREIAALKDGAYLPVSGKAAFKGAPLSDDEIRFIGWVMTDGHINKHTRSIAISQGEHQPWLGQIPEAITGCGLKFGRHAAWRRTPFRQTSRNVLFTVSHGKPRGRDRHLRGWAHLEKWISKDFSDDLLWSLDYRQFGILLNTLNLADGKKHKPRDYRRRTLEIGKGNRRFIERLQMACVLRGYRANLTTYTSGRNQPFYVLHIRETDIVKVGAKHDSRPAIQIEPPSSENCWCVENELGTLVTRRNGKVVIMGNCQLVGRGTRIHPGKDHLLLLDFLFQAGEHKLIRPAHLVAADESQAQQITAALEDEEDLEEALRDAEAERMRSLAARLRANRHRPSTVMDALELAVALNEERLADFIPEVPWHEDPPTAKQLQVLQRFGIDTAAVTCKGHASLLLDRLFTRKHLNLATPRQVRILKRMGVPQAETIGFEEARAMLSARFEPQPIA